MSGSNESALYSPGALRRVWRYAGAPVDGTSGTLAGIADKGDLLIDTTNANLYQNTNTQASPTWTQVTASSVAYGAAGAMAAAGTSTANAAGSTAAAARIDHVHAQGAHDHSGATKGGSLGDGAVTHAMLAGGFSKINLLAGGAAGDHTLTGITATDEIIAVLHLPADGNIDDITDITSEFTAGAGKISNDEGTDTTGDKLLVFWNDITA